MATPTATPTGANRNEMSGEGAVTRQQWIWTVLASMASYIDAGSIVAGAVALPLWAVYLHMSPVSVGLLGAFSSNGISTAIGALIGGRLGDLLGRKRIYAYDLLVYAFGALWLVFAVNIAMLFVGYILIGLAVGADVPTSWSLVGEFSPNCARGKLLGLTQVFWSIGPIVSLVLGFVLAPYGVLGARIIFAQLVVVALITWALRRGMVESARWSAASGARNVAPTSDPGAQPAEAPVPANPLSGHRMRDLFRGPAFRALLFTAIFYTAWNTAAGTYGFFLPYLLRTVGSTSQATAVGLNSLSFIVTMLACILIFMPFGDGSHRRLIFVVGAVAQVVAFLLFLFFPLTIPVALANILLFGAGGALAGEPFYRVWSQELFPTLLRGTAQGVSFFVARVVVGVWSFFVPVLAAATGGFKGIAAVLLVLLLISGFVGTVFMPNTAGKSLEEIQEERARARARRGLTRTPEAGVA